MDFHIKMEDKYAKIGNKEYINVTNDAGEIIGTRSTPDRVFFRGQTSAKQLHEMYLEHKAKPDYEDLQLSIFDGGCSESCEVYEATL